MIAPRRLVIGEEDVLLCEGIERVLAVGGFEVAARDAVETGHRRVHAVLTYLRES